MFTYFNHQKERVFFAAVSRAMVFVLSLSLIFAPSAGYAQTVLSLPPPGAMVTISPAYNPAIISGITLYPNDPLRFDFLVDIGDDQLQGEALKEESQKLVSYFMAALTVPEDEMWVNLSPYEKDRIIAQGLGNTEMGQDMLAQDYILKQLTASLMYPEDNFGKEFWKRIYAKAQEQFGTTEIPTNTFNKIWIIPEKATVSINETSVFVVESRLKVMLEEDYLALESNRGSTKHGLGDVTKDDMEIISGVSSQIVREILLPEIEREVNEGKNFANLRQIYNSMILATWYKKNLNESLLGQIFSSQNKTNGIDVEDKEITEKIYKQYVEAFQKGVYNYIREDYDAVTQEVIPRKYFSGGLGLEKLGVELGVKQGVPQRAGMPHAVMAYDVSLLGRDHSGASSSPIEISKKDFLRWGAIIAGVTALTIISGSSTLNKDEGRELSLEKKSMLLKNQKPFLADVLKDLKEKTNYSQDENKTGIPDLDAEVEQERGTSSIVVNHKQWVKIGGIYRFDLRNKREEIELISTLKAGQNYNEWKYLGFVRFFTPDRQKFAFFNADTGKYHWMTSWNMAGILKGIKGAMQQSHEDWLDHGRDKLLENATDSTRQDVEALSKLEKGKEYDGFGGKYRYQGLVRVHNNGLQQFLFVNSEEGGEGVWLLSSWVAARMVNASEASPAVSDLEYLKNRLKQDSRTHDHAWFDEADALRYEPKDFKTLLKLKEGRVYQNSAGERWRYLGLFRSTEVYSSQQFLFIDVDTGEYDWKMPWTSIDMIKAYEAGLTNDEKSSSPINGIAKLIEEVKKISDKYEDASKKDVERLRELLSQFRPFSEKEATYDYKSEGAWESEEYLVYSIISALMTFVRVAPSSELVEDTRKFLAQTQPGDVLKEAEGRFSDANLMFPGSSYIAGIESRPDIPLQRDENYEKAKAWYEALIEAGHSVNVATENLDRIQRNMVNAREHQVTEDYQPGQEIPDVLSVLLGDYSPRPGVAKPLEPVSKIVIEDTTKNPRPDWLLGGNPDAIKRQERKGQRELSLSDQLPVKGTEDESKWAAIGVELGEPVEGDPLFRKVKLPAGWKIVPTGHDMRSDLVDDKGRIRANIFYKAAFYDRRADVTLKKIDEDGDEKTSSPIGDNKKPVSVERFVELLNGAILGEGEKVPVKLRNNQDAVDIDKTFVEEHRDEIIGGIRALRQSMLDANGTKLEDGPSYIHMAGVPGYHIEQAHSLMLIAVGDVLGLWRIIPGLESKKFGNMFSQAGAFPMIQHVDMNAIALSQVHGDDAPDSLGRVRDMRPAQEREYNPFTIDVRNRARLSHPDKPVEVEEGSSIAPIITSDLVTFHKDRLRYIFNVDKSTFMVINEKGFLADNGDLENFKKEILLSENVPDDIKEKVRSSSPISDGRKRIIYIVQEGETLTDIAHKFRTTTDQIAEDNDGVTPHTSISPGQEITIRLPEGKIVEFTHLVRKGETLYDLHLRYGITLDEIAEHNNMWVHGGIEEGQELKIILLVGDMSSSPVQQTPEHGGIDFNPNNLDLSEQGAQIQFNMPAVNLENIPSEINFDGILPVIINISPVPNLYPLLGLKSEVEDEKLSFL